MQHPEELRPGKTRDELTAEAAERVRLPGRRLRARGHDPHEVAHFLDKLLFCMFAEDAGLLPADLLRRLGRRCAQRPRRVLGRPARPVRARWPTRAGSSAPNASSGSTAASSTTPTSCRLTGEEIALVERVSRLDWSQVEPAIFGTLFERGLDPSQALAARRALHRPRARSCASSSRC